MFIFVIYKVIFKELEIFVIFEFIYYFQMDVKSEDPDENFNPWVVTNLDEFLFFCCPECDSQSPNKALFINHALIEHPKAREIIPNLEVDEVPLGFEDDKLRLESDSKVPTSVLNEEEIDLDLLDLLPEGIFFILPKYF